MSVTSRFYSPLVASCLLSLNAVHLARAVAQEGTWQEGDLEIWVEDDFQNERSKLSGFLRTVDANRIPLAISPDLLRGFKTGDRVRVRGNELSLLKASAGTALGPQSTALILAINSGIQPPMSAESAHATLGSLNDFFTSSSYGLTWLTGLAGKGESGDVYGPVSIDDGSLACGFSTSAVTAAQSAYPSVNFSQYRRIIVVNGGCEAGGVAQIGGQLALVFSPSPHVSAHEFGHTLGRHHAAAYVGCDFAALGPIGCTVNPTEDPHDVMGYHFEYTEDFSIAAKELSEWTSPFQDVVYPGSGTHTYVLDAQEEATSGKQRILVPYGSENLHISYRKNIDNDLAAAGEPDDFGIVEIHYAFLPDSAPHGADVSHVTSLNPGEQYVDSLLGLRVTALAGSPDGKSFTVEVSDSLLPFPCMGFPHKVFFTPVALQGGPGEPVPYKLSVVNYDFQCAPKEFTLQAILPSGWNATFQPSTLIISPSSMKTATMVVTPPPDAAVGQQFSIGVLAKSGLGEQSAFAVHQIVLPNPFCAFGHLNNGDGTCTVEVPVDKADGSASKFGMPNWDLAHDATSGTLSGTGSQEFLIASSGTLSTNAIYRGFFSFDTSSLPSDSEILGGKFSIHINSRSIDFFDGYDYLVPVESTPANPVLLSGQDFDQCGSLLPNPIDAGAAAAIPINALKTGFYNDFALNAAGLQAVKQGGWTTFALREGHDFADFPPTFTSPTTQGNFIWVSAREGKFPAKLQINYGPSNSTGLILSTPAPGIAGTVNSVSVGGAMPNQPVYLTVGLFPGATPIPGCPGLSLSISLQDLAIVTLQAGSYGTAVFQSYVGPGAVGVPLLLQAVDLGACKVSNLISFTF